jgi:hypothetical protein
MGTASQAFVRIPKVGSGTGVRAVLLVDIALPQDNLEDLGLRAQGSGTGSTNSLVSSDGCIRIPAALHWQPFAG